MNKSNTKYGITEARALIDLLHIAPLISGETTRAVRALQNGIIFEHNGEFLTHVPNQLMNLAITQLGSETLKFNQTLHKSFNNVVNMPPEEYYFHQVLHYLTTYGFESVGLASNPYIPLEKLEIPGIEVVQNKIVIIRLMNDIALERAVNDYFAKTAAPKQEKLALIGALFEAFTGDVDDIKSFELKVMYCDKYGVAPTAIEEALRYLIYKVTGTTLLIKNDRLIQQIRSRATDSSVNTLPMNVLGKISPVRLAEIFFRYKPLLLAFKGYPGCARIINRARRLADKYHRPLSDVSVKNFTTLIDERRMGDAVAIINRASARELVKLANAVMARIAAPVEGVPGVFSIRNGRVYVTEVGIKGMTDSYQFRNYFNAATMLLNKLREKLHDKFEDTVVILPNYITYAVPTTEKQFIGNIPWGSSIALPADQAFTAGIHWVNSHNQRVDLDLHLNSASEHFGWNGGYTDGVQVIYTGDQTDAPLPNGAAEAFYFKVDRPLVMGVNEFSGPARCEFKFFLSGVKPSEATGYRSKYTFDPSKTLMPAIPLSFMDSHHQNLGIFTPTEEGSRFFFYGGMLTEGIVPNANYGDFLKGTLHQLTNKMTVAHLLGVVGASVVSDRSQIEPDYKGKILDLSPEALTSRTLLDLLDE